MYGSTILITIVNSKKEIDKIRILENKIDNFPKFEGVKVMH